MSSDPSPPSSSSPSTSTSNANSNSNSAGPYRPPARRYEDRDGGGRDSRDSYRTSSNNNGGGRDGDYDRREARDREFRESRDNRGGSSRSGGGGGYYNGGGGGSSKPYGSSWGGGRGGRSDRDYDNRRDDRSGGYRGGGGRDNYHDNRDYNNNRDYDNRDSRDYRDDRREKDSHSRESAHDQSAPSANPSASSASSSPPSSTSPPTSSSPSSSFLVSNPSSASPSPPNNPTPSSSSSSASSPPPSSSSSSPPPSSFYSSNDIRSSRQDDRGDYRSDDRRGGGGGGYDRDRRGGNGPSFRRTGASTARDSRLEAELFGEVKTGIEFKNYENIPVETSGLEVPNPIEKFSELSLHETLAENVTLCGYEHPTPIQKYGIPIALANRDLMAAAQTGSGKCWGKGTPLVLMNGNIKFVENIQEGDELLGDDSTPRLLQKGSLTRAIAPMYKIDFSDSSRESFSCNGDHIFVLTIQQNPHVITSINNNTTEYTVKQWEIVNRIPQLCTVQSFSSPQSAEFLLSTLPNCPLIFEMDLLTFLSQSPDLQSQSRMYQPSSVTFTPQKENIFSLLQSLGVPPTVNTHQVAWAIGMFLSGNITHPQFHQYSAIVHSISSALNLSMGSLTIPHSILCEEVETRRAIVSGILDGSSTLDENSQFFHMKMSSDFQSLISLCRSVGLRTSFSSSSSILTLSGASLSHLSPFLTSSPLLKLSPLSHSLYSESDSFSVIPLGDDEYYGFTLDGNGRCLLGNYIVTHNTFTFLLPMVASILKNELHLRPPPNRSYRTRCQYPCGLILSPTRELASQIHQEARKITYRTGLRTCVVYGGAEPRQQLQEVERGCDILVATPGRLLDFIERGRISLTMISFLVFDEADRMLDMGFEPDIRRIVESNDMPVDERQTLMFSATFPKDIQRLAADFLKNYIFIAVGRVGSTTDFITQKVEYASNNDHEKNEKLMQILSTAEGLTLIFVEKKRGADALEFLLMREGIEATSIHGDRSQEERENALHMFKIGRCPVLVATDVASRGLDIPDVRCVINYDMPSNIDDYVHRIGRTGRAGNKGTAIAFVNESDKGILKELNDLMKENNQEIPAWFDDMVRDITGFGGGGYGRRGGRGGHRGGGGGGYGGGGRDHNGGGGGGGRSNNRDFRSNMQGTVQKYNAGGNKSAPSSSSSNNNHSSHASSSSSPAPASSSATSSSSSASHSQPAPRAHPFKSNNNSSANSRSNDAW